MCLLNGAFIGGECGKIELREYYSRVRSGGYVTEQIECSNR